MHLSRYVDMSGVTTNYWAPFNFLQFLCIFTHAYIDKTHNSLKFRGSTTF